jgi:hypothetical protein
MTEMKSKAPPSALDPPLDPSKFASSKYTWEDLREIIANDRFPILRHVDHETTYRLYSQKLKREWKSICDFVLYCKFGYQKRLIPVHGTSGGEDKVNTGADVDAVADTADTAQAIGDDTRNVSLDEKNIVLEPPTNKNAGEYSPLPQIESPPKNFLWESYPPPSKTIKQSQRSLAMNDFPYYMEDGIEHWCLWKLGGGDVDEVDIKWAKKELNLRSQGDILEMLHWINPVHLKSLPEIDHAHIICLRKS